MIKLYSARTQKAGGCEESGRASLRVVFASDTMPASIMRLLVLLLACCEAQIHKDMLKAINDNNPSMVAIAIKSFGKVNAVGEDGDSVLLYAVRNGKYKAVKALLNKKADIKAVDASGLNAMHVAASVGSDRVLQVLGPTGLDRNSEHEADGLRPIHRAVLSGSTDAVKTLLNAEVPADQPTADGRTPMQLATSLETAKKSAMEEVLRKFARPTAKAEL